MFVSSRTLTRLPPVRHLASQYSKPHGRSKRRMYEQRVCEVDMASFVPLVFPMLGGLRPAATVTFKQIMWLAETCSTPCSDGVAEVLYWFCFAPVVYNVPAEILKARAISYQQTESCLGRRTDSSLRCLVSLFIRVDQVYHTSNFCVCHHPVDSVQSYCACQGKPIVISNFPVSCDMKLKLPFWFCV